jgi:HK97 gp10 family phage protein
MAKDIDKLIPDIENKFEDFKTAISLHLEAEAVKRVPVDTGNLKASIKGDVEGDTVWIGAGFTEEVNYAKHVEFGTSRMKAQPFIRPAVFVVTQKLNQIMRSIFK